MSRQTTEKIFIIPTSLHPDTANLVGLFAEALAFKLAAAQEKYGYTNNWMRPDWMNICRHHLLRHLEKGDPRDVAAYCAFLWHHGESTIAYRPDEPVNQQLLAALKVLRERHSVDEPHHEHLCEYCRQADAALADAEAVAVDWHQKAITALRAVHNKFQSRPYGTGSYIPKNIRDMVNDALSAAPKSEPAAK